jgi:hypothetical protein
MHCSFNKINRYTYIERQHDEKKKIMEINKMIIRYWNESGLRKDKFCQDLIAHIRSARLERKCLDLCKEFQEGFFFT